MNILRGVLIITWSVGLFILIYACGLYLERRRRVRFFLAAEDDRKSWLILYRNLYENKKVLSGKNFLEEKIRLSGIAWDVRKFAALSAAAGAGGIFAALVYLKNLWAAIPLGVCSFLVPYTVLTYYISRRETILTEQLGALLQYFVSEYGTISNITVAFHNILPKLNYPLKLEVERMLLEISSGSKPEDAFYSFAQRVNSRFSYQFAHILSLRCNRGLQIQQMLFRLYMDLKIKRIQEKERNTETIGVKLESYFLYLCIPLIYLFAGKINPESHYLLTRTPDGQKMMVIIVLLLLTGIVSTIRLSSNKVR